MLLANRVSVEIRGQLSQGGTEGEREVVYGDVMIVKKWRKGLGH